MFPGFREKKKIDTENEKYVKAGALTIPSLVVLRSKSRYLASGPERTLNGSLFHNKE